ncbi:MAG: DUF1573 domain-containing protein [Candidatus Stahlbacteria bacterium]|nr:MAG: DUF1573 domain-containing protein [Candidatus Stahlbacteria bacterium]
MNFSLLMLGVLLVSAPKIEVSEQSFDFGYAFVGEHYRHTFWIYNRGDEPLEIKKIRTFCGCTATELKRNQLAPGDSTSFDFIFDTHGFFAERVKWAYIRSNDPRDSLLKVNVTIRLYEDYSRTPFRVEPAYLHFNRIDSLADEVTLKLVNFSDTGYNLQLIEAPAVLKGVELPKSAIAPEEELQLSLRPMDGIRDPALFKSSVTFEAWTPTEIVRFSVPLHIRR